MRTRMLAGRRYRRRELALLVLASGALAAFGPGTAIAGTFTLHQCGGQKQQKGGFKPAEPHGSTYQVFETCSDGGGAPALEVNQISSASEGRRGFWYLAAQHSSLRFTSVAARVKLVSGANARARLVATDLDPADGANGSDWGTFIADGGLIPDDWTNVGMSGLNHSYLKLGIQCFAPTCAQKDGSAGNPVQTAKGRNFVLTVNDSGAPVVQASGPLLTHGSLIKGTESGGVSAFDPGAGIHFIRTKVNGSEIQTTPNDCANIVSGTAVAQNPCTSSHSASISDDVGQAPWKYGSNAIEVCAYDYRSGGSINSDCTRRTVLVDDRPDGPTSIGGAPEGWINDRAKFAATVGVPSSVAPLTTMHYRLIGPSGYERLGSKTSGFGAVAGPELPALGEPGRYTLRIWFEDSLGNVNEGGTARSVDFKYDPVKPEPAMLEDHPGWISAADVAGGFRQTWEKPSNDGSYPSGLRGYAILVSAEAGLDPCQVAGSAQCDPDEINHSPSEQSFSIGTSDRRDGKYYVTSVPVTNADNRGRRDESKLFIDQTAPEVGITGLTGTWSRSPLTITVSARDGMSGMDVLTPAEMPDGPPITAISVGFGDYVETTGDTARTTIAADGVHRVRYYARDVAGNRNDGSVDLQSGYRFAPPATATARIDATPPSGAFRRPTKEDPTLLRIPVTDATSGVRSVKLQLRRRGSDEWVDLVTSKRDGEYAARIDESKWPEGVYDLRALATDVAGNPAVLDSFADGQRAELTLPLRERTAARIDARQTRAGKDGRSRWHKIGHSERPVYTGVLHDSRGNPVRGRRVKVRERFDAGAAVRERILRAETDGNGRYRVVGSRGPSRATRMFFEGDARYRPVRSSFVRTLVEGRVKLVSFPRSIQAGRPAVFRGTIGHRGVRIPRRGKIYEVQLLVPGEGWKTLDQAQRSRRNGRFRFPYRFRPVERAVSFRIRVQVKRDPEWAYTQARSRKVTVTVRP